MQRELEKNRLSSALNRFLGPAFWPGLDPTELIWDQMKIYVNKHFPLSYTGGQRSSMGLREIFLEAKNSISSDQVSTFIEIMPV